MYLAYNESFRHLQAHEVALLTVTTPLMVAALSDMLDRAWRPTTWIAATLAAAGAAIVGGWDQPWGPTAWGVALVQASNLAFAVGQLGWRRWQAVHPDVPDREVFGLLLGGGALVTGALAAATLDLGAIAPSPPQVLTLGYLGVIASGVGFFAWNRGVAQATLGEVAVMNNAKVPLAVLVSVAFFGERVDLPRILAASVAFGAAVWLVERPRPIGSP